MISPKLPQYGSCPPLGLNQEAVLDHGDASLLEPFALAVLACAKPPVSAGFTRGNRSEPRLLSMHSQVDVTLPLPFAVTCPACGCGEGCELAAPFSNRPTLQFDQDTTVEKSNWETIGRWIRRCRNRSRRSYLGGVRYGCTAEL